MASSTNPSSPTPRHRMTKAQKEHEAFKNRLVDEVLGEKAGDKVPMEKVVMLIWQFRDDPSVVSFMARFMAKYSGVRHVLDGIEFYLPQLAHMIIHLEVEWDDDILERFALIVAQQSIHFALQLNWILQGAMQDYQPENDDGTPNENYNQLYYRRCLTLLKNVERCVVYGKPRAAELQRLYEQGKITKKEMQILEHADRRFAALHIITQSTDDQMADAELEGWLEVSLPTSFTKVSNLSMHDKSKEGKSLAERSAHFATEYVQRYCVLDSHVLNVFIEKGSCGGGERILERAMSLEQAEITNGTDKSMTIHVETPRYHFSLRCTTAEDHKLWLRRLEEEAYMSVLFQSKARDKKVREDLTPAQLDRYEFFENERRFVWALTDLAEELRDKDRDERKKLAPQLMQNLEINNPVYLPLCNSSDLWRRVSAALPKETRVFNTKERCPVIMNFISRRGEMHSKGFGRIDPNVDVAEYMHLYFDVVPELEEVPEDIAGEEMAAKDMDHSTHSKTSRNGRNTDRLSSSQHDGSYSGVWEPEDDDEPQTPLGNTERAKGNMKVQRLLRESVVTLPNIISKRLKKSSNRKISVMDRQTEMQPMVPILEGRNDDADNQSLGDGTVVSVERSSILLKDKIILGDLEEGDIDMESLNRAKKYVCHGENWAEKSYRMLEDAQKASDQQGENVQLEITTCMSKSNDDLRQEVFVMQMIHYYKSVFAQAKLPLWLKTYRILSSSSSTGLLEVLTDATSIDGLKKSEGFPTEGGLRKYFEMVYGGPDSASFKAAQRNFMQSLAAYGIVSYLLGLKDRHNGNIMIDTRGHLIFIDFGFAMGMAPGHEFSMERAPFKLTKEYVEVMGGRYSECYKEFKRLFVAGFEECRKNSQIALGLVEIMMYKSNYPCFSGSRYGNGVALTKFESRLMLRTPDDQVKKKVRKLIRKARGNMGTYLYDVFQKATNGYAI